MQDNTQIESLEMSNIYEYFILLLYYNRLSYENAHLIRLEELVLNQKFIIIIIISVVLTC